MKFGIVVFPGTWSDGDCHHALTTAIGQEAGYVWYKEEDLSGFDCVVLPGGFSYGDYLRPGAIARFTPIMTAVERFASAGGLVIGICNGFQVLCEAGLLPGILRPNKRLQFRCEWTYLKVENTNTPFTLDCNVGDVLRVPISHGEGNYSVDPVVAHTLSSQNRVLFRYSTANGEVTLDSNPNGSFENIAGIVNKQGNVLGMMPHPERCCEAVVGGTDGAVIFRSIVRSMATI
ncbi:phosphoribosylformylglycinamidine synthase subunit PurQ [SAR202 cluster bacterium AD-804-J14_MRT_500m]|nr:phosphoribosylformylglycinamidine synthase subunit PurQ [SAR202 cluster bacterium AD-804-J14_MRT_500m]